MRRSRQTLIMRVAGVSLAALVVVACSIASTRRPSDAANEIAAGKRIYRQGIGVAGAPVQAVTLDDVHVSGPQTACVSCHRPSGLGSDEGGYYVPPINAPILFAPRKLDRRRLFRQLYYQIQPERFKARLYQPHMRPGYTAATLATVLRTGVDPAGDQLASIMPRYQLTDADITALAAYLHTLSAHVSPGVTDREIRLAAVFSDGVPPAQRDAMLGTLKAYVAWRNLHLHYDLSRHTFSAYNRSEFVPIERHWSLAVWYLKGNPTTWRAQLESHYKQDPVFALAGGKVAGSWSGPSQFCDAQRLPCLFPDTELPAWPQHPYGYTVYFSAGLMLEAEVAAHYVAKQSSAGRPVIQIAAPDAFGQAPAQTFARALDARWPKSPPRTIVFHNRRQLAASLAAIPVSPKPILVAWPGVDASDLVNALAKVHPQARLIILPSRAIDAAIGVHGAFASQLRFVDPYELDMAVHVKSFETRGWMHARGLQSDHMRLRFKEYYAMSLLDAGLFDIGNDFYRDYLLERMEDESQEDLNPGMYPSLALSPGQRFAAKVAEIVRLDPNQSGKLVPTSSWLTP